MLLSLNIQMLIFPIPTKIPRESYKKVFHNFTGTVKQPVDEKRGRPFACTDLFEGAPAGFGCCPFYCCCTLHRAAARNTQQQSCGAAAHTRSAALLRPWEDSSLGWWPRPRSGTERVGGAPVGLLRACLLDKHQVPI